MRGSPGPRRPRTVRRSAPSPPQHHHEAPSFAPAVPRPVGTRRCADELDAAHAADLAAAVHGARDGAPPADRSARAVRRHLRQHPLRPDVVVRRHHLVASRADERAAGPRRACDGVRPRPRPHRHVRRRLGRRRPARRHVGMGRGRLDAGAVHERAEPAPLVPDDLPPAARHRGAVGRLHHRRPERHVGMERLRLDADPAGREPDAAPRQ